MFLGIVVNLYAVRVVWQVLGVEDYGVYNVVGGIVIMFAFLNNAMISSSQRFISYELGTGDSEKLHKVFSLTVTVHIMLAILILILAETIGLWFLNFKLNIPTDRMVAANWVYQCSILTFMINVISVPYNSCIVAHEHMKAFGYFGILEVILKLVIVFMLIFIPFDKLITYAILVVCVTLMMRFLYGYYCHKNFKECNYKYMSDRALMREMFSFAGWSFVGNIGFSVRDQGLNIVLNLFFNVAVNAAKGIATQVGAVIYGFAQNFQMALSPQITKRYAAGETEAMMSLVFRGCKFSVILMMFIIIPFYFTVGDILNLWLGEVAPYTIGFTQLVLIMTLVDSIVNPITTALQATGKIKWFQIIISIIMLSNLPLAWFWLRCELNPYIILYVTIFTSLIGVLARLILLHREIIFSYWEFFTEVICRIVPVFFISGCISWIIYQYFKDSFLELIIFIVFSIVIIGIMTFLFGLNFSERNELLRVIKKRI